MKSSQIFLILDSVILVRIRYFFQFNMIKMSYFFKQHMYMYISEWRHVLLFAILYFVWSFINLIIKEQKSSPLKILHINIYLIIVRERTGCIYDWTPLILFSLSKEYIFKILEIKKNTNNCSGSSFYKKSPLGKFKSLQFNSIQVFTVSISI